MFTISEEEDFEQVLLSSILGMQSPSPQSASRQQVLLTISFLIPFSE